MLQPAAPTTRPDFAALRRRFGFRSIGIGHWVSDSEKARAAEQFHTALTDLMSILSGTETLISLRGHLSFHYGIGGQPGVSAHYEPARRTLALAKNAGPGSLAHEWFHALDHYLGARAFTDTAPTQFASSAWLHDHAPVEHPLNDRLSSCFRAVLLNSDGTRPSALFAASARADESLGCYYYSRPEELCARAFEAFVQDAPIANRFLVRGTLDSPEARQGLYPLGEQRQEINSRFRAYFDALGSALRRTI